TCAALVGFFIVALPLLFGGDDASDDPEHLRLGGEALKILAVNVAAAALLFIDMLFAKHHFSGVDTGYFGAASTVAKTIPYGVGLIALVSMPSAAAARHTSRDSLRHILRAVALLAIVGIVAALLIVALFAKQLISVTYGPHYTGAIALLPLYAIDEALLAGWAVASSYLVAIGQYRLFGYMLTAVVVEAVCMAWFGTTPLRLLTIGIATNAALAPTIWMLALRSLK
ncbi:MAG: hypothetical protein M3Z37_06805, partial [Candidatus Eremiobacteraeota bacterium]|nr:hypothetical protein [Candidatus Eremiobacteraeota bacterium]